MAKDVIEKALDEVVFKLPYSKNERVSIKFENPSLTDQSFKQECDIGFIIENFVKTGTQPDSTMNFMDCTTVKSYEESMQLVAEANSNFENLPAKIRDEFKTVTNYLAYISDVKNLKDSYERGLIDRGSVDLADVYPEQYKQQIVNTDQVTASSSTETPKKTESVDVTSKETI